MSPFLGVSKKYLDHEDFKSAGRILAKFHKYIGNTTLKQRFGREPLCQFCPEVKIHLSKPTNFTKHRDQQQEIWRKTNKFLEDVCFCKRYSGLQKITVHGDFCNRNILWDITKNEISGLIDLELLSKEIPSYDICFFTSEYAMHNSCPNWKDVLKLVRFGYCEILEINRDEMDLLETTLLLVTMYRFKDAPDCAKAIELSEQILGSVL